LRLVGLHFARCVTLLQGFLVWGTVLRVFEPMLKGKGAESILEMSSWEQALIGQTYFIYYAPFTVPLALGLWS
jgi:hypothetical protein